MLMLLQILCAFLLICSSSAEDVSFQNVTLELRSEGQSKPIQISLSNNLKDFVKNVSDEASITVRGSVPVLYENSVSELNKLSFIALGNVGLEEIKPGAFRNLDVNRLDLSSNKLKVIVANTFGNVSLKILQIFQNNIRKLEPGVFNKVVGLSQLSFSSNELEEIDREAFDNPTVTSLDLQFNSISTLRPGDLKNLPKLQSLELLGNKLTEIPEGVFNNTTINTLKLNYNAVTKIATKAFDDMPHLSVVHFDHNRLTTWDNNWLHNTPKLAYVVASYNLFQEIPAEAFKNYPKVYSIALQGNKIKRIDRDALKKSKSIVNFDLRDNLIENWDENILGDVVISTVFLDDNKIKCIDGDLKTVFKSVYGLVHLHGNPWDPDCAAKTDVFVGNGPPPKLDN